MKQNSKSWIWLLLLLYAFYAAYWGKHLAELLLDPVQSRIELPVVLVPIFRALLG